ncbi:S-methyl-5'-thioadenosine phosphorylase [Pseudokineococcus sp. 1T1Z-3]|uniref:S-methyl-5'-thioadenosine phosphorylase n=1 Tax=Pseudokineococcus sp. 1T1Z-3 TaxID=3132745 RepID=UPI0030A2A0C0
MSAPTADRNDPGPDVGVVGGSGLYALLEDAEPVTVATPWGEHSDGLTTGTVGGRRVAFLPRHGRRHTLAPHRIGYRANLWALRSLGVRQLVTVSAVGSLRPELVPGTLVLPDQVVDRTWGREHTFYDGSVGRGAVVHVPFADPYCPVGRVVVVAAARARGQEVVEGGTLLTVQGPRFSSRAESRVHADAGWSVVGMTGMPEAALARELALCCTALSVVTDHDAGVEAGDGVTHAEVLEVFAAALERVRAIVLAALQALPRERTGCACAGVLDGLALPFILPGEEK